MPHRPHVTPEHPVLLYDGTCALCNRSVQFVLDRDPGGLFQFAALDSEVGRALLARHTVDPQIDSVVLIEGGRAYTRSTAALHVARRLRGAWRLLVLGFAVPRFLRDGAYDYLASRRIRWFGRVEACRFLAPELRSRFLDL